MDRDEKIKQYLEFPHKKIKDAGDVIISNIRKYGYADIKGILYDTSKEKDYDKIAAYVVKDGEFLAIKRQNENNYDFIKNPNYELTKNVKSTNRIIKITSIISVIVITISTIISWSDYSTDEKATLKLTDSLYKEVHKYKESLLKAKLYEEFYLQDSLIGKKK